MKAILGLVVTLVVGYFLFTTFIAGPGAAQQGAREGAGKIPDPAALVPKDPMATANSGADLFTTFIHSPWFGVLIFVVAVVFAAKWLRSHPWVVVAAAVLGLLVVLGMRAA